MSRDNHRYNQAVEISWPLLSLHAWPLRANAIRRRRGGPPQSSLPANRRQANVRGAFEVVASIDVESILIVDDVVTTGATLSAVARALKRGGARRIYALAVAQAEISP